MVYRKLCFSAFRVLFFIVFTFHQNFAQTPGSIDLTFGNPVDTLGDSSRFYSGVNALCLQPDGKIIAGGVFRYYNGIDYRQSHLIRLTKWGDVDLSFANNVNDGGGINAVAVDTSGNKIYVGGSFYNYSNIHTGTLVRLNSDGNIDTSFIRGTGFAGDISVIAVQPDNKVLVGGIFINYNGNTSFKYFSRVNMDGSIDTSFLSGSGFDGEVSSIAIQPDGKILAGGNFTHYNGYNTNRIVRLFPNGSIDTSFNVGTGCDNTVKAIVYEPSGKIILGGYFSHYNGTTQSRIVCLNGNGDIDNGFNSGTGFNINVFTLCLQPNGTVIVGGMFNSYNNTSAKGIVKLTATGSIDTTFYNQYGTTGSARTIISEADGNILVGGTYAEYDNTYRYNLARIKPNGILHPSFAVSYGFNANVLDIESQPDGKILAAGMFRRYNGVSNNGLVRLFDNGDIDPSFKCDSLTGSVTRIKYANNSNKIYLVGSIINYRGIQIRGIARLNIDGSIDTTFNVGVGFNNRAIAIDIQNDGKILVAGSFDSYNGQVVNHVVRILPNGNLDNSFNVGTGTNVNITDVVIQPDSKILVCGTFNSFNGYSSNNIVRLELNGSVDQSFLCTTQDNSITDRMKLLPDGKILISKYSLGVKRYNTDGSLDNNYQTIYTGYNVSAMDLQPDGKIIVSVLSDIVNGISRFNYDGSIDNSFDIGYGFNVNSYRHTLKYLPTGKILLGGAFDKYNAKYINCMVSINSGLCTSTTIPTISVNNSNLVSSETTGNQWYDDEGLINGATGQYYTPTHNGVFYVKTTTPDGCQSMASNTVSYVVGAINALSSNYPVSVFPNPTNSELMINADLSQFEKVIIYNISGQLLFEQPYNSHIDVSSLSNGLYFIEIKGEQKTFMRKFLKI